MMTLSKFLLAALVLCSVSAQAAVERTFSIIKPDATGRNLTGKINAKIEEKGFRIIAQKRVKLRKDEAEGFYAEHKDRPFFKDLVNYMTSGPVVLQVLEEEDAIQGYRALMGATNPGKAEAGTLRKEFAESLQRNAVHGSDSRESADREIAFFFDKSEIVG